MFRTPIRKFCEAKKIPSRDHVSRLLKNSKRISGLTYAQIAKKLNKSEIYVASVFNGQHPLSSESDFEQIHKLLLSNSGEDKESLKLLLSEIPVRGQNQTINQDPTVYRLNEIVNIYGSSIKELIEEKAGNGIMSAIDCKVDVQVVEDGMKNKRIEIKINGKFLQYDC